MGVTTEAWAGWYEEDGIKEPISVGSDFTLLITAADGVTLSGSGVDGLGSWTWKGRINSGGNLVLEKRYVGGKPHDHVITYTGIRKTSVNGLGVDTIDGTWKLVADSGTFQLQQQPYALEETHSGYYEQDGTQYPVTSVLYTTADNKIYGSGSDDLGDFTWTGEIDPATGAVTLHKLYLDSTVAVDYTGTKSFKNGRNVIEGLWGDASANNKFFLGVQRTPDKEQGPWTGYYVQNGQQQPGTNFTLEVAGSGYTGHGYDDVGEFIWEGDRVGLDQLVLRKKYLDASGVPSASPDVVYTGTLAFKQVIDGTWNVPGSTATDLFHFEFKLPSTSPPSDSRPFGTPVSILATDSPNASLGLTEGSPYWTGYYVQDGQQHPGTNFTLEVAGSGYTGHGYDEFGKFIWEGDRVGEDQVILRKKYLDDSGVPSASPDAVYTGTLASKDGKQVIDGTWNVPGANATDLFHFEFKLPSTSPPDTAVSIPATDSPSASLGLTEGAPYWTGYYVQDGQRHPGTNFTLEVAGSGYTGHGYDEFGKFIWEGDRVGEDQVILRKKYLDASGVPSASPDAVYTGTLAFIDGKQEIDGTWNVPGTNATDLFHFEFKLPSTSPPSNSRPSVNPVSIPATDSPNALLGLTEGAPYWTGYYVQDGQQHPGTNFTLEVAGSGYTGHGYDEFGQFIWEGDRVGSDQVILRKKYLDGSGVPSASPDAVYTGTSASKDGKQVMDGTWNVPGANATDLFHFEFKLPSTSPPPDTRPSDTPESIRARLRLTEGAPYWTGYYVQDGQQYPGTNFTLEVAGSGYTGNGYDDSGEFIWEGDREGLDQVVLRKKYLDASGEPSASPDVVYTGTLAFKDGKQVIDGTWNVPGGTANDLFHFEFKLPSTS